MSTEEDLAAQVSLRLASAAEDLRRMAARLDRLAERTRFRSLHAGYGRVAAETYGGIAAEAVQEVADGNAGLSLHRIVAVASLADRANWAG